jgi:hypothetical protein
LARLRDPFFGAAEVEPDATKRAITMARGVYLIGSKLAQRVRAVQIVDCAGNSTTLRLKDYLSRKIQPEYKVLPWQEDVALVSANAKSKSK